MLVIAVAGASHPPIGASGLGGRPRRADLGEPEHPAAPGIAATDLGDDLAGWPVGVVHHLDDGHPLRIDGLPDALDPMDLLGPHGARQPVLDQAVSLEQRVEEDAMRLGAPAMDKRAGLKRNNSMTGTMASGVPIRRGGLFNIYSGYNGP